MQLVGLTHRATFQKNYLNPAIKAGLIERRFLINQKTEAKVSSQIINLARKINLLHLSLCG
jgi:hypothetical protein